MALSYLGFPRGSCATYRFGCIRWRRVLFARRFPNRFLLWTLGSVPDLDFEQRRLQPAATNLLWTGAGRGSGSIAAPLMEWRCAECSIERFAGTVCPNTSARTMILC